MNSKKHGAFKLYELIFPLISGFLAYWFVQSYIQNCDSLFGEHSGRTLIEAYHYWIFFLKGREFPITGYPPLCSWLYCLGGLLNDKHFSSQAAVSAQALLLIPLNFAVYFLGRRLGGVWGGLLALVANLGNFQLNLYNRGIFLEVGETLFVCASLAAYLASHNFRRLGPSLIFGICVGLGMLTKWALIFYLLPLFAYALFMAVSAPGSPKTTGANHSLEDNETVNIRMGKDTLSFTPNSQASEPIKTSVDSVTEEEKENNSEGFVSSWIGMLIAFLAALSLSGWWYWAAWQELLRKSSQDLSQNYSGLLCFSQLLNALNNSYWLYFNWFFISWFFVIKRKNKAENEAAFLITVMSLSAISIYMVLGVPGVDRYVLPASVMGLCLAFSWMGNYRFLRVGALVLTVFISAVQMGLIDMPHNFIDKAPTRISWRIPTLSNADNSADIVRLAEEAEFTDKILSFILPELDNSGETRFTAVAFKQGRGLDVDLFLLRALEKYNRLIDIDIYVPVNCEFVPQSSLLLQISGKEQDIVDNRHFRGYKKINQWINRDFEMMCLYQNNKKRDRRVCRLCRN
ncbi:MAG: ArnT family glycosyltransferase [Candidatus Bruticola sp.]